MAASAQAHIEKAEAFIYYLWADTRKHLGMSHDLEGAIRRLEAAGVDIAKTENFVSTNRDQLWAEMRDSYGITSAEFTTFVKHGPHKLAA
jgi:hypothetical protein